jgi:TRAP-type C4-dicarboxylate transport system substrate-binding protein
VRSLQLIGPLAAAGIVMLAATADAQTLRAISFIPKNDPVMAMAAAWVSDVNAKLAGQIRINMWAARK